MKITHAVIPAAGLGTRFLPFTKVIPKEMLPILNKPAIEYIVKEGIDAGIHTFDIIVSDTKQAIIDHLNPIPALEHELHAKNKLHLLAETNALIKASHINPIHQDQPRGLGHAILMARQSVGNEYCAVLLPDDVFIAPHPAIAQLIHVARTHNATVIGVQHILGNSISSYGVVAIKEKITDTLYSMTHVVEKPAPADAPSTLAIIGRYVFSPAIFDAIDAITPHAQGEIQLTDAINHLIKTGHPVIACVIEGTRYDIGQPAGWIQANIDCARAKNILKPEK